MWALALWCLATGLLVGCNLAVHTSEWAAANGCVEDQQGCQ